MEEILHHLRCIKPCKSWDKLPVAQLVSLPDFWSINRIKWGMLGMLVHPLCGIPFLDPQARSLSKSHGPFGMEQEVGGFSG